MTAVLPQTLSASDYRAKPWSEPGTTQERLDISIPVRLAPVVEQIMALLNLREGWNSYQASRVQPAAVVAALRLLTAVDWSGPLPSVAPTLRGGIQLEWGNDDDGVEIVFGPQGSLSALVDLHGEMTEFAIASLDDPALHEVLIWAEKLA